MRHCCSFYSSVGTCARAAMGLLDHFREVRAMRYQRAGDRVNHPATLEDSSRTSRPRRKLSSSSCSLCYCLWCVVSFLIILIILAGITVLAIYIVFLPKLPKYSLQDVTVTALSVTNRAGGPISSLTDLQNPVLNANIAFTIQVENPNEKLGIHYRDMSVFVFYQGTQFAHSFIAPFYQRRNSSSQVVVDMTATSAPLSERQGKELQAALSQNDVPLLTRINVGAALDIRSWVLPPGHVHIVCDLRISPPTAPHGTKLLSKSCKWLH